MNGSIIQLLVLAAIAVFLITRLMNVLGTREGFEKPPLPHQPPERSGPDLTVIDGGPDRDIVDHVEDGSDAALALAAMKRAEPAFSVGDFLAGARGAYEMILMAFERGNIDDIRGFISDEVAQTFDQEIAAREARGETIDATFIGVSSVKIDEAEFDENTQTGDITIAFTGELTTVVKNADGETIHGDPDKIIKQRDSWTFSRQMGSQDPNWRLVATG